MLEEALLQSEYEYEKIAEDVFLIKDFITEQECISLLTFAENADWTEAGRQELVQIALQKHNTSDIDFLIENNLINLPEMFDKIAFLNKSIHLSNDLFARMSKLAPAGCLAQPFDFIQRHTDNSGLSAHVDEFDGVNIKYGAIAYLQQGDIGGEIYFHPLDLSVLPPARSLLIFRSQYLHEVKPVFGKTTRYAMPSYFYEIK